MYYLLSLKSFSFWYRKWLEMWFNRQNVSWTMSTLETPKWLEILKEAGPLFGDYLQEALASKLARVLPNNCVLLPDERVKNSFLVVEQIFNVLYCPLCDDCSVWNMIDKTNVKDHCKHTFVAKNYQWRVRDTHLDVSEKDKIFVVQENPYFP